LQQLQWKEKWKKDDQVKARVTRLMVFKYDGNEKQAGSGRRLLGMEEDRIGSQG
jgi:hypothetical protein